MKELKPPEVQTYLQPTLTKMLKEKYKDGFGYGLFIGTLFAVFVLSGLLIAMVLHDII